MPNNKGRHWPRGRVAVLEHGGFPKGSQFDPVLPQRLVSKGSEQDSESLVAPDEQVDALRAFHRHSMNVCVNG